MRELRSALVAYYNFDFKDASKRDIRGLMTSLLLQLVDDSDRYWDLLSQLHEICRVGSEQLARPRSHNVLIAYSISLDKSQPISLSMNWMNVLITLMPHPLVIMFCTL